MTDAAVVVKFQKYLDPQAQEFWPRNHLPCNRQNPPYPFSPAGVLAIAPAVPYRTLPPPSSTPTRSLVLLSVPRDASESMVTADMSTFGDVRAVRMDRLPREGIVAVDFHDLRSAEAALGGIRRRRVGEYARGGLVAGKSVWAYFSAPLAAAASDAHGRKYNHGTLLIQDLDDGGVTATEIQEICEVSGCVKEARVLSQLKHRRPEWLVEFYDVRDAAKALTELNGKGVNGKGVNVEFADIPFAGYVRWAPPPATVAKHFGDAMRALYRGRPLRNRPRFRSDDDRSLIIKDVAQESDVEDTRATLMIKNIPNKYSKKLLMNMLDNHCIRCNENICLDKQPLSSYDFLYLPIDFYNKCNVGYGFINLTSPQAAWRFYKAFHRRQWEIFNSQKTCEITYARLQGLEALKAHFRNSRFECAEEYLPVIFSPPRDGKHLTEPSPIAGHSTWAFGDLKITDNGDGNSNRNKYSGALNDPEGMTDDRNGSSNNNN